MSESGFASDEYRSESLGMKRPSDCLDGTENKQPSENDEGPSEPKKPHLKEEFGEQEQKTCEGWAVNTESYETPEITENLKKMAETFVLMIPTRANSKTEGDPVKILHFNFPGMMGFRFEGSKSEGGWTCELRVNPTQTGEKPKYLIASSFASTQRDGKYQTGTIAVQNLKKYCTLLEPNPEYFKEGRTPEFIEKRIPCNKNPRSYLLLSKKDTGHISPEVADKLLQNFMMSSNEDMFFIDTEFNLKEKQNLMNRTQKHKLGFRHFGSKTELKDHHICIYKHKKASEVLEEARILEWKHPKYLITLKESRDK